MTRRFADRADWPRVLERRFDVVSAVSPEFSGHITRLCIDRVAEPLWRPEGDARYQPAGDGFIWLQHFPVGARHTLTTMFDQNGTIVQWCVDICSALGVDERGVPWFDDLYLDIVILPTREVTLRDEEELHAAVARGEVSIAEYEAGHREALDILLAIRDARFPLLDQASDHLRRYFDSTDTGGDPVPIKPKSPD